MGRKRVIDPESILDAAEAVLQEVGAARLTLDAVARRAGVSKGGLVYAFKSKDDLITALLKRDIAAFDAEAARHAERYAGQVQQKLLGHIAATRHEDEKARAKAISLVTALVETPARLAPLREAYGREFAALAGPDPLARRARVAFLAAEGAFLLRGLGLVEAEPEAWDALLDDIRDLCLEAD